MSGRKSRSKGSRGEYQVRDYFRSLGFESHRVPASGAAEGFKGDVVLKHSGQTSIAEVKVRKDAYKHIYAMLDNLKSPLFLSYFGCCVIVSYEFKDLGVFEAKHWYFKAVRDLKTPQTKKGLDKVLAIKKLVGKSDFLVIKIDYKPLIFIRYIEEGDLVDE